jgi:hypothetical protein
MRLTGFALSVFMLLGIAGTTHDPETDMPLLITVPRQAVLGGVVLLNGTASPPLKEMRVGIRYRLRIINVHTYRPSMIASLRAVGVAEPLQWRAIAEVIRISHRGPQSTDPHSVALRVFRVR